MKTSNMVNVFIIVSILLASCDSSIKRPYRFKNESLHWMQFRGSNASGIAPDDANPPVHFDIDTNLLWKTEVLPGWSSPCIVNEKIFLTEYDISDSTLYTKAYHRKNGEILWTRKVKPDKLFAIHAVNSHANQTIASDGTHVFSYFPSYGLIAYDLDGNLLWEYTHESIDFYFGGSSSPVILDSIVIISLSLEEDPRMMGLHCESGDSIWTIRAKEYPWSGFYLKATPVFWKDLMILNFSRTLVAYNIQSLEPEWWLPMPSYTPATPVIINDLISVNLWLHMGEEKTRGKQMSFSELIDFCDQNKNGTIEYDELPEDLLVFHRPETPDAPESKRYWKDSVMFAWANNNKNESLEKDEWENALKRLAYYMEEHGMIGISAKGKGERPITDIKWKVNEDTPETPSPLLVGEDVLFIKNGGIITVINHESGEVVFKERIGAPGTYLASPMLAGDKIYLSSFNGTITILSSDDFSLLAQNKLKEKIGASPVAVDDVLYIRTTKHLYAFR